MPAPSSRHLALLLAVLLASLSPAAALSVAPVPIAGWQRALAGAAAYCSATLISSPVDVVKTRLQVTRARIPLPSCSPRPSHNLAHAALCQAGSHGPAGRGPGASALRVTMHLLRTESLLVFYAGIGPALLMAPAAMVTHISPQPPLPLPEPCHRHAPPHGPATPPPPPPPHASGAVRADGPSAGDHACRSGGPHRGCGVVVGSEERSRAQKQVAGLEGEAAPSRAALRRVAGALDITIKCPFDR